LLQFLAQGYSCPRKVLINADIHLLHAPDASEFENVNFPDQYQQALQQINNHKK
jgi:molybdopterin-guanine dinucleotide biosynthesis protein A